MKKQLSMMSGFEHPYEARALRKDGTTFPCEIQGKMMRYRGRQIRVTALVDITERKEAEQKRLDLERQVQNSQKLESLGVLAGGIAHDFNNLLMVVLGNIDLVLDSVPGDAEFRPQLLEVEQATRRAADLRQASTPAPWVHPARCAPAHGPRCPPAGCLPARSSGAPTRAECRSRA